ncbi:MAG: exo-alpha-sialidase [Gemmatimonadales bacterium]|nr:MAG: exo-alpha-sialidase [Gemmatimonadales bacterium]
MNRRRVNGYRVNGRRVNAWADGTAARSWAIAPLRMFSGIVLVGSMAVLPGCGESPPDVAGPTLHPLSSPLPSAAGAGMPFVAGTPDGFLVSWTEPTGRVGENGNQEFAVRWAALDGEGNWSEPGTLAASDDFFVNWADFPSIAYGGDGRMAAHWLARSGEGTFDYDVVVSASTNGGASWSEPRILHADGVRAEHGFVSFFPQADGFGAVWLDGREMPGGGPMTLRAGLVEWDGTPRDQHLLDPRICECCQTGAALTDEGVVVVYRGRSAGEIRDIHAVRQVNGRWEAPSPIHADGWNIAACPVNGPAVSARGRDVVAGWFTGADDVSRVRVAFSGDAGATWSEPVQVDDGAPMGRVDVELLPDGSALVVWLEAGGDNAVLLARRVWADGRSGPTGTLAGTSGARASGFPRMAVSEAGRILLAWTEPGGAGDGESAVRAGWLEVEGTQR